MAENEQMKVAKLGAWIPTSDAMLEQLRLDAPSDLWDLVQRIKSGEALAQEIEPNKENAEHE